MELRLIAVRADENELGFRIDAAPVVGEHPYEIVLPLVRRDPPHEEKDGPQTLPARQYGIVWRQREMLPVEKDRYARRLLVSRLDQRAAVELGHADPELERRRDARQLPQPKAGERRGVRVDAAEELGGRDVVIDEHAARRDLDELVDDLAAHREVDDQEIFRLHVTKEAAVRPHVGDAGLGLDRVRERFIAPVPDLLAQRKDVVAHRVARSERRMELMDSHFGAWPMTA